METYSFKSIWQAIYNKMLEITTWNTVRVWAVYNHDIKIEWWVSLPAIIITPSNWTSWYLDSCSYETVINYSISLVDRIQENYADVEDNIREVADIVMSKLKEISTISWTNDNGYTVKCEYDFNWWWTDTQEPLRVFSVNCRFTVVSK